MMSRERPELEKKWKEKEKEKEIYIYIIHTKLYCRYRMVAV